MARVEVITIPKPPYSPDLIPPNFFLFAKVINLEKMSFREHWQHQNDFDEFLKVILVEDFQIYGWIQRI